jgi:hypothetical protein
VQQLKRVLPVHEVKKATRAVGIVPVRTKAPRISLKDRMRMAKLKMKAKHVELSACTDGLSLC